jgi:hypothetical protein
VHTLFVVLASRYLPAGQVLPQKLMEERQNISPGLKQIASPHLQSFSFSNAPLSLSQGSPAEHLLEAETQ